MELREYQKEALSKILEYFDSGKKSGVLIMPAGTGKSLLSMYVFKTMAEEHGLSSMAYVGVGINKAVISQLELTAEKISFPQGKTIRFFSYQELATSINHGEIRPSEFQLLIFDDIGDTDESTQLDLKAISDYFVGFKLGLSPIELKHMPSVYDIFDGEVIFNYTFEQVVADGELLTHQKAVFRHFFNTFQGRLNHIDVGTDWSQALKRSFIQPVQQLERESEKIQDALDLLLSGKIENAEVVEMSYRKEQLNEFSSLMNDDSYFDEKSKGSPGPESVWQKFFESNPWIFGFGLNFIFNSPLAGKKLEQTVEGFSVRGHGKRTDALLRTTGLIQTLCFGEIKTHRKSILKITESPYRSESWAISDDVAGGIAQIQRTVQKSLENIKTALSTYDEKGFTNRDPIFLYKPKSFLIIGSLSEFMNERGEIHEDKFSSFELFRRSLSDIEIITFDELYERANALINRKWNRQ